MFMFRLWMNACFYEFFQFYFEFGIDGMGNVIFISLFSSGQVRFNVIFCRSISDEWKLWFFLAVNCKLNARPPSKTQCCFFSCFVNYSVRLPLLFCKLPLVFLRHHQCSDGRGQQSSASRECQCPDEVVLQALWLWAAPNRHTIRNIFRCHHPASWTALITDIAPPSNSVSAKHTESTIRFLQSKSAVTCSVPITCVPKMCHQ